jgi:hypothetical protein
MRAGQRSATFLACLVAALFLATPGASAKSGYSVFPGYHEAEMRLKGSRGYEVQISARDRRVVLTAYKSPSLALYLIPHARQKGDQIEAKFPGVGRISMRFHPAGPPHREPGFFPPCTGGETITQPGYFQGAIRFRGERSFTAVRATRVRGRAITVAKEICKRSIFSKNPPDPKEDATRLVAYSKSKGRVVTFSGSTTHNLPPPVTSFFGGIYEHRAGMSILRQAYSRGSENELISSTESNFPLSAIATPPDPFHGSASFQRTGGDNAWTGSLSVSLPGAGRIDLAGQSFAARLCQHSGCHYRTRHLMALSAQGSGSQSQAFWDARDSWSR